MFRRNIFFTMSLIALIFLVCFWKETLAAETGGTNLLANSSFEGGTSTDSAPGWAFHYAGPKYGQKIERSAESPWDGKYCVKMYSTQDVAEASNFQISGKPVPYDPKKKYVLSFYAKGFIACVQIQYYDE